MALLAMPVAAVRGSINIGDAAAAMSSALARRISMASWIASGSFTHVIATDPETLAAAALARNLVRFRLTYDAHEYYADEAPGDTERSVWVRRAHARAAPLVDAFITVNAAIAGHYSKTEPWFPTATIVSNCAPASHRQIVADGRLRKSADLPADARIALFQGGLYPHRGLQLIAEVARNAPPRWAIVTLGSGPLAAELHRASNGRLIQLPPVPPSELPYWTADADIGLILYEGGSVNQNLCSPTKLWEFPAVGVPILGSPLPVLADMIQTYGIGDICQLKHQAVRTALCAIDQEQMTRWRRNARAFSAKQTWEEHSIRYVCAVLGAATGR